ncbi:type I toxin-antitoxin system Fst family toxin [Mammaliicoccus sciuri]
MEFLLVDVVAPVLFGIILALFSHWLDQRKS